MKLQHIFTIVLLLFCSVGFMACEQQIEIQTVLHKDGSLKRTILLKETDSARVHNNYFGANESNGWHTEIEAVKPPGKDTRYNIRFTRNFKDIAEANAVMNGDDDAVFKIRSELTEKFRWFYTYYRYSDTYISINRLDHVSQDDYFTTEDFTFINRLPGEGKPLSKADSFYLDRLNKKVFDDFAMRGIFESMYQTLQTAMEQNHVNRQSIDKLASMKEAFFKQVTENDNFADQDLIRLLEKIDADLDTTQILRSYREGFREFERKLNFMSDASSFRIGHSIELPWTIMRSNCDSLANHTAYWNPPAIKFSLQDYEMYAEGREMNILAVSISLAVILITVLLYARRRATVRRAVL